MQPYSLQIDFASSEILFKDDFSPDDLKNLSPITSSILKSILYDESEASTTESSPVVTPVIDCPTIGKIDLALLPEQCKTRAGSKKFQHIIAKCRPEDIEKIVIVMAPHMGALMTDVYGNYMCQSLIKSANSSQRLMLLSSMRGHLLRISKDSQGTHSLQGLICLSSTSEEELIYRDKFSGHIIEMAMNVNASHVIQRLLVTLKDTSFIIRELLGHVTELAIDKLGLCVIKKCIGNYEVYKELLSNAHILVQDPYGNYAIQQTLDLWGEASHEVLANKFKGKVAQLCIQKYASNVMEKCMHFEYLREALAAELLNEEKMKMVLNCAYGCYVVKSAAEFGSQKLKEGLRKIFNVVSHQLHQKKLKSRWIEIQNALKFQ
ncbi:unnamed protein product [Blepharisma stoltei]|uniref:PUM-HD domain-containing protein n=1 Tax=Blepharisma stoltei TaxID=1481888 RepID=A0AAU9JK60_9CILI|nr:unnamed protein product [Blepharisma stoltei]